MAKLLGSSIKLLLQIVVLVLYGITISEASRKPHTLLVDDGSRQSNRTAGKNFQHIRNY